MSTARPRHKPYLYVTWLTKLLTGDNSCLFAPWFKAHYQGYQKTPSDFNAADWKEKHTALLRKTVKKLLSEGYEKVYQEDQNKFTLYGKAADLVGKPDLLAVARDKISVIDCKTGLAKESDVTQVKIYMWALPLAERLLFFGHPAGLRLDGEVVYQDHSCPVPNYAIGGEFVKSVVDMIQLVAADAPCKATPSLRECSWCELTEADCPSRFRETQDGEQGETSLF